jgi:hypothetical protein
MSNFDQRKQNVQNQVNQIINQQIIINNGVIDDELVKKFIENLATLLPLEADSRVKKDLLFQVILNCANSGQLPLSPEDSLIILAKLNKLSLEEFHRLLSTDRKYEKLKVRLGWFILGGSSVGAGVSFKVTSAHYEEIIQDLKTNNELYTPSGAGRDLHPPHSEPDDQDNLERFPKRSPIRDSSSKSKSPSPHSSDSFPQVEKRPTSGNDPLPQPKPPSSSTKLPRQHQNPLADNLAEQNIAPNPNAGAKAVGRVGNVVNGGTSQPQLGGGLNFDNCGDCGDFSPDCDCFIATAVYGSRDAREVISLRRFRDEKLMCYSIGRLFIRTYYKISPPIANYLRKAPYCARVVRYILSKLILILNED